MSGEVGAVGQIGRVAATPMCEACEKRPAETIDIANGRRCGTCPPVYRPEFAAHLAADGFPDLAGAHLRTHIHLTQQRIAAHRGIREDRAS